MATSVEEQGTKTTPCPGISVLVSIKNCFFVCLVFFIFFLPEFYWRVKETDQVTGELHLESRRNPTSIFTLTWVNQDRTIHPEMNPETESACFWVTEAYHVSRYLLFKIISKLIWRRVVTVKEEEEEMATVLKSLPGETGRPQHLALNKIKYLCSNSLASFRTYLFKSISLKNWLWPFYIFYKSTNIQIP